MSSEVSSLWYILWLGWFNENSDFCQNSLFFPTSIFFPLSPHLTTESALLGFLGCFLFIVQSWNLVAIMYFLSYFLYAWMSFSRRFALRGPAPALSLKRTPSRRSCKHKTGSLDAYYWQLMCTKNSISLIDMQCEQQIWGHSLTPTMTWCLWPYVFELCSIS